MKKLFLPFVLITAFSVCSAYAQTRITAYNAVAHIGKTVTIRGKVFDGKWAGPAANTTLYVGGYYPNEKLMVIIPLDDRDNFSQHPEQDYDGKDVIIKGRLLLHNHKPEIVVSGPWDLKVVPEPGVSNVHRNAE